MHAEVSDGQRCSWRLATTWLPAYDVATTIAPTGDGLAGVETVHGRAGHRGRDATTLRTADDFFILSTARRRRPLAVSARFVLACSAGHLDDFPYKFRTTSDVLAVNDIDVIHVDLDGKQVVVWRRATRLRSRRRCRRKLLRLRLPVRPLR
ncbi:MAG: hypothetical protein JO287_19910 [Pseudonocardiales bacterium]|nr:hypothetical protein [Pseudonocardiales bacterium]